MGKTKRAFPGLVFVNIFEEEINALQTPALEIGWCDDG